ncbi:Transcription initiation factor TFIID subunit 9 [Tilletia horrida]|uniref:Transcription initiation factor TFIID subunit 9 n=1 Tax=Tilletia horrida TaxID=155126 RepID=A0AAN6GS74_9BASI|nr:Transcription initiation factor TFIID subunit 9 [Tilletia horrida]KAK0555288.1 Transcription initiation factor TFIID subunit 9 [Tilletia horrida]KAK0569974.1 Transcription initiation factor TFIID subunit 9 [Tilletia horrida]
MSAESAAQAGGMAGMAGAPIPRDARIIAMIMYSMGITDADPAVLLQLLEFAHRYTHDVLQDALVYSDHAASRSSSTSGISLDDIQLAIQSRVNYSFTAPPPKDVLLSLASSINAIPLPPISDRVGIRLPPPEHCLTNVNFSIVPNSPPRSPSPEPIPAPRSKYEPRNGANVEAEHDHDQQGAGHQNEASASMSIEAAVPPLPPSSSSSMAPQPLRGTKRTLEEDEDYD